MERDCIELYSVQSYILACAAFHILAWHKLPYSCIKLQTCLSAKCINITLRRIYVKKLFTEKESSVKNGTHNFTHNRLLDL